MEFASEIISETSFSDQKLGNYSLEMELCSDLNKNDELFLYILWSIPALEEEICIDLEYFLNEDLKSEEKEEKIDSILIQQLTQKDKQIVKQQEQIEHLQKLLENQQILTLKAQEKVQLLESKEEIIEESKEENKNFWQKIFGRSK